MVEGPSGDSGVVGPTSLTGPTGSTGPTADTTAPTALLVTPVERTEIEAGDTIVITLSEPIAPSSIPASLFASGLAASVVYDEVSLTLTLIVTTSPALGAHALTLSGLTDVAGNAFTGVLPVYLAPRSSSSVIIDTDGESHLESVDLAIIKEGAAAGGTDRQLAIYRHAQGPNEFAIIVRARIEGQQWLPEHIAHEGQLTRLKVIQGRTLTMLVYVAQDQTGQYLAARALRFGASDTDVVIGAETILTREYVPEIYAGNFGDLVGVAFHAGGTHPHAAIYDGGWVSFAGSSIKQLDTFTAPGSIPTTDRTIRVAGSGGKLAFAWTQQTTGLVTNVYGAIYDGSALTTGLEIDETANSRTPFQLRLVGLNRATATFVYSWIQDAQNASADRILTRTYYDTALAAAPEVLSTSPVSNGVSYVLLAADASDDEAVFVHTFSNGPSGEMFGYVCGASSTVLSCASPESIATEDLPRDSALLAVTTIHSAASHRTLVAWRAEQGLRDMYAAYSEDDTAGQRFGAPEAIPVANNIGLVSAVVSGPATTVLLLRTGDGPSELWQREANWTRPLTFSFDSSLQAFPSLASRGPVSLLGYVSLSDNEVLVHDVANWASSESLALQRLPTTIDVGSARYISGENGAVLWTKAVRGDHRFYVSALDPITGFASPLQVDLGRPAGFSLASYAAASSDFGLAIAYIAHNYDTDERVLYLRRLVNGVLSAPLLLSNSLDLSACTPASTLQLQDIYMVGGDDRIWLIQGNPNESDPCVEGFVVSSSAVDRTQLPIHLVNPFFDSDGARLAVGWTDADDHPHVVTYENDAWQNDAELSTSASYQVMPAFLETDLAVVVRQSGAGEIDAFVRTGAAPFAQSVLLASSPNEVRMLREPGGLLFLTVDPAVGTRGFRFVGGAFAPQLTFACSANVGPLSTVYASFVGEDLLCVNTSLPGDVGLLHYALTPSGWSSTPTLLDASLSLNQRAASNLSRHERALAWAGPTLDRVQIRRTFVDGWAQTYDANIELYGSSFALIRSGDSLALVLESFPALFRPYRLRSIGF
jgi:hypothetical protein